LNQITSADDGTSVLTPTYDARGNITSYNGQTFGYETYNRLTSVGGTGGSVSLDYDPLGRLWQTSGPSGTARYQYDGAAIIATQPRGFCLTPLGGARSFQQTTSPRAVPE